MPPKPLDCDAVLRQLWDYLDGELSADRLDAIRSHLQGCAGCLPHAEFERVFLDLVAMGRHGAEAPEGLRARVMAALVDAGLGRGA